MSSISLRAARSDERASPLYSALFLLLASLILARIGLNALLLDLFMSYTAEGGSIIEKIHPIFWGFLVAGFVLLVSFRIVLTAWELAALRALLAFCATVLGLLAFAAATGGLAAVGYLVDTYLMLAAVALLFAFPPAWRRGLGQVIVAYMLLGCLVAMAEFALGARLMPFTESEPVFRPTGLTAHPLDLGLWCAVGIGFAALADWPRRGRLAAVAVLLLGCVASGARLATMVSGLCAVTVLLREIGAGAPAERRGQRRLLVLIGVVLLGPLLLAGLAAAGAFGRFSDGVADDNAMARITVYGVFSLMSWRELLLGGDIKAIAALARERFGLPYIESAFVVFVVQFGILGTVLLLGMLARLIRVVLIGAPILAVMATVAFFAVALSNNGLATKSSSVFLLLVLIVAFHPGHGPGVTHRRR